MNRQRENTWGWGAVVIVATVLVGYLSAVALGAFSPEAPPAPTVTMTAQPPTEPTYGPEERFAAVVTQNGVAERDLNLARGAAQSMCVYLTAGDTIEQAKSAALQDWTYGPRPTAAVIGGAAFFCPQHADVLNAAAHLGVES